MIARNIALDKEGSRYGRYDTFHTTTSSVQHKVPKCANVECHKV